VNPVGVIEPVLGPDISAAILIVQYLATDFGVTPFRHPPSS
jgi:hypothetical protein